MFAGVAAVEGATVMVRGMDCIFGPTLLLDLEPDRRPDFTPMPAARSRAASRRSACGSVARRLAGRAAASRQRSDARGPTEDAQARFKDEVCEVQVGQKCEMAFGSHDDLREGDGIESLDGVHRAPARLRSLAPERRFGGVRPLPTAPLTSVLSLRGCVGRSSRPPGEFSATRDPPRSSGS